ncbi:MAG: type II toxin-antitoxin system Phd/YefM family antitoxin [Desulfatiglans sp.]|jgi:prevent-host-death family protein|nr:type II toxin-antitoxin system Phd/YefM family antitoxin [Desulfatiglans sp.]
METVNINEAKVNFSKLLARVNSGEEIIIARSGKPCARLIPFNKEKKRVPGIVEGKVTDAFFEALPDEELARWE